MLEDLIFTETNGEYISTAVQVTSDVGIHIELPDRPAKSADACIDVEQSMTGSGWVSCDRTYAVKKYYDKAVEGVIPGMYLRVKSTYKPTVAKILM